MPNPWLPYLPLLPMAIHRLVVWAVGKPVGHCAEKNVAELPITWFRPLKGGVREIDEKIARFLAAIASDDQAIFGVDQESAEWELCTAWARRDARVSVVACEGGLAANPKIAKLSQMGPLAKHGVWVVMDAEAVVGPTFISAFRADLAHADAVTAGYRMVGMRTVVEWLDALPVIQTLWPGLALVRRFGRLRFTLGACTGFRKKDLEALGGWERFANDLAEDNRLGALLDVAGRRVVLSTAILDLESDALSWRDYWRHQIRVAVTYRVATPWGAAGMILPRGFTLALLFLLVWPTWAAVGSAAIAAAVHIVAVGWEGRRLGYRRGWWLLGALASDVVESCCWLLSWGTRRILWGGREWRITGRGEIFAS